MGKLELFSKSFLALGAALLKGKRIKEVFFSEGTYQMELVDPKTKQSFWPFLQLDDAGHLHDAFCTCSQAEKKKTCEHLAAAYLKIFNGNSLPLHVRFRESLWNALCQIAGRRHGYLGSALEKKGQGFEILSATRKCLFAVKGMTGQGRKKIENFFFQRPKETEENSLKFSKLAPQELQLWREGRPSQHLQYELSPWSDLAKWCMLMQEEKEKYTIVFDGEKDALAHWVEVRFNAVRCGFYIARVNWPHLIPALATVKTSLTVSLIPRYRIKAIRYDEKKRVLSIEHGEKPQSAISRAHAEKGVVVGEWLYIPKKGFFPAGEDPFLDRHEIPEEMIGALFHKHAALIGKYLVGTTIHPESIEVSYALFFDENENLHVCSYLFKEGDLTAQSAVFFGSWVFLVGKGFYLVENRHFEEQEKIVPRSQMNDFINEHRSWLSGIKGFQTHIFAIESFLRYRVSKEGLRFEAELNLKDIESESIDFGEWIYLKGKGFFMKRSHRTTPFLHSDETVPTSEISSFIKAHSEDLEGVQDFFSHRSPLEKSGVDISLNAEGAIVVSPRLLFYPQYQDKEVTLYGDYTYVEGEGFCEIPSEKRLPESFQRPKSIKPQEEAYFVFHELEMLKDFLLSVPKELIVPSYLSLRLLSMKRSKGTRGQWIIEAHFETDLGKIPLFSVWKALMESKRYLFSPGGLLLLKPLHFSWLRTLTKRQWQQEGGKLKVTTLDWLRLSIFEEVLLPEGNTTSDLNTRALISTLQNFKAEKAIDLTGFQSELRAYQEVGVRWLFFLYMHGLSGLLCDEMGLGKTHQAMGLLASVRNSEGGKFLVVCPTSVIYHWEALLQKFLPDMRVLVFYGLGRSLDPFEQQADLLLTSYGTLRSEIQALSKISFSIAIFDEVQCAKNAHSQTHKALRKIDAAMRLGLTGTPIENRLLELKSLFDVVLPGYMPQEAQFKEYFVNPIDKGTDPQRKLLLGRLTRPFILRRKKADVLLELPEKIEEISYCDLSGEQRELYEKAFLRHKDALFAEIERGQLPLAHIFSLFSTLKQICDHPCLITKQYDTYRKHHSGKWDLFVELLEETRDSGQKIVIFSQYLGMLDIFAAYLTEQRIGFASIRGATRDRKEQLEKFRSDPACEVFLASLQAAGVGIDLVSASVVIHYDRWWNPARENQATDRVHRIGQNRGVQVFKLVTKDTIEEHIHFLIEKKMALLEDVLSFDEQDQIKGLNREEIVQLLRQMNATMNRPN